MFLTHFIRSAERMQAHALVFITTKSPPSGKEEKNNLKRRCPSLFPSPMKKLMHILLSPSLLPLPPINVFHAM
jgi:hypothetical protein